MADANPSRSERQTGNRASRQRFRGFTLLEVTLALGLTVLIMYLIGSAIYVHLRMLDTRRTNVEEAQVARAILRMIGDDLRRAVHFREVDLSSVEELVASSMEGGAAEAAGSLGLAAEDGMAAGAAPQDEPDYSENIAAGEQVASSPGIYGNMNEIMIDISRLPREDEYPSLQTGMAVIRDLPSDIKSVAYFLGPDPVLQSSPAAAAMGKRAEFGLIRRELDRAVTRLAMGGGVAGGGALPGGVLQSSGELIAPEVVELQFAYFDGFQMLGQWDSTLMGGLPVAVEIRLTIASAAPDGDEPPANLNNPFAGQIVNGRAVDEALMFRLLVPLPTAEPYQPPEEEQIDPETGEPITP